MKLLRSGALLSSAIRSSALLVVVLLVLNGCGAGDDGWTGSVEVLDNGVVRVTNPSRGVWDEGTGWRLEPELVIGDLDGGEATTFATISALEADADGRIYVVDRQANELRIFERDGTHVRSAGRSGAGPGEYSNANGLLWMTPDTLLIVDQRGNRYSVLTRNGDFVRSVPRRLGFFGWAATAYYHDSKLYEQSSVYRGNDLPSLPALFGTHMGGPTTTFADRPAAVAAADEGAATHDAAAARDAAAGDVARSPIEAPVDTVLLPVHTAPRIESFSHQTERGGMVMGVPFAPSQVYHLTSEGRLWHGHGSEFRLLELELASGDTLREILLEAQPVPVTREELDLWLDGAAVAQFREMGGRIDESRIPSTKPLFSRVVVDDEGYIWTVLSAPRDQAAFAVFDPDGRYLGRLGATGLNLVSWVQPVVRNGRLYVVGQDELEVQRVYVFRLEGRERRVASGDAR